VLSLESPSGIRLWTSITGSVEVVLEASRSRLKLPFNDDTDGKNQPGQ
jgi:hypothetical protein